MNLVSKSVTIFFFFIPIQITAQNIGFGCFGFTGGYAGYSFQKYQPSGLNENIKVFNAEHKDSLTQSLKSFGSANGFRVGINFFRKKYKSFFFTGKGFYQLLIEKDDVTEKFFNGDATTSYEVKFTNWGLGIDLGTPILSFLNWKIIDASLLYNQIKFSNKQNLPGTSPTTKNYRSDFQFGYSVGTGIIIEIYGEYITLEGSALFSRITINEVKTDDGIKLTVNENSSQVMNNFITDGGFNALVQLNVGIPL